MNKAMKIMRELNPHARILVGKDRVHIFEDIADSDGPNRRFYSVEYEATPDGKRCVAWLRHNPWSTPSGDLRAGTDYHSHHVASSGHLCLGDDSTSTLARSPYGLRWSVERTRYWVMAFSYAKENNAPFPNL